jgi:hypothetical protein
MPAKSESDTTKSAANGQSKPSQEWPALVESGAGLSEAERGAMDPMAAPMERLPAEKFSLAAEVRKRPMLYIGLGALALGGVAAIVGRKAIFRAAAPMLVKAAAKHPVQTARLAARHPKATYRLIAMGVEPTVNSGLKTIRGLPQKVRDLDLPQRVRDLELQQRLHDIEATLTSTLQAVRELPQTVRDKVAHRG